jgi:hypothetical protein
MAVRHRQSIATLVTLVLGVCPMQSAIDFPLELSEPMNETRVEILILQRLEQEQKEANGRLEKIAERLNDVDRRLGEVRGEITGLSKGKSDVHWSVRNVLAPLLVALIVASVGLAYHGLDKRLGAMEEFLRDNGGFIAGLRLEKVQPSDPKEAEQILAQAKKVRARISPEIITESGTKFINASANTPTAWSTALAFLNYRSFLNPSFLTIPAKQALEDKSVNTTYSQWTPTGKPVTTARLKAYGTAPKEEAAAMTPIGFTPNASHGNKFIILYDGNVVLDNTEFRHVIISNAHVLWDGGAIIMQDVYFINCTFDLPRANGQSFAAAILSNTSVNFQSS